VAGSICFQSILQQQVLHNHRGGWWVSGIGFENFLYVLLSYERLKNYTRQITSVTS
jgi:hypothetical protein